MQFDFVLYIDYYKMAQHFNLVKIYKGMDRMWKFIFIREFSFKAEQNNKSEKTLKNN